MNLTQTHLESELSGITGLQKKAQEFAEDNFTAWREALEAHNRELESIKNALEKLGDQQRFLDQKQSQKIQDLYTQLEILGSKTQSSLLLLESQSSESALQKIAASGKAAQNTLGKNSFTTPSDEEVKFETKPDGKKIARTYRRGKLAFEIFFNEKGEPQEGKIYAGNGKLDRRFEYVNGQVKIK